MVQYLGQLYYGNWWLKNWYTKVYRTFWQNLDLFYRLYYISATIRWFNYFWIWWNLQTINHINIEIELNVNVFVQHNWICTNISCKSVRCSFTFRKLNKIIFMLSLKFVNQQSQTLQMHCCWELLWSTLAVFQHYCCYKNCWVVTIYLAIRISANHFNC